VVIGSPSEIKPQSLHNEQLDGITEALNGIVNTIIAHAGYPKNALTIHNWGINNGQFTKQY